MHASAFSDVPPRTVQVATLLHLAAELVKLLDLSSSQNSSA
jgi:hypothetical protein